MSDDTVIKKVESYDGDGSRVCLNFVCENCLKEAMEDYEIVVKGETSTKAKSGYWCDNCGVGNDHPTYQEKVDVILNRKLG